MSYDPERTVAYDRATGTIHLQNLGRTKAKPAKDFAVGEKMLWNGAYTSTVLSTELSASGKTVTVVIEAEGIQYVRRFGADRLIAIGF
jgi:hypothetical protein